jgi:hypothetical protein
VRVRGLIEVKGKGRMEVMYRLYFDTCILNDTFPLLQRERDNSVRPLDLKIPLSRWAAEYVALYHLLDLDDQWELEFGTSEVTLQKIVRFRALGAQAQEKKAFLEDISDALYRNFLEKCKIESKPIIPDLFQRAQDLLEHESDAMQICQAIQGGWEFFITTDFRTILVHQSSLEELVFKTEKYQGKLWPQGTWEPMVEKLGIKARSPLQFLEQYLLPLPMLIRTLYGSWTDPDEFINQTGRALLALSRNEK